MPHNSRKRKVIYRPITAKDRETMKALANELREKLHPKQQTLKLK